MFNKVLNRPLDGKTVEIVYLLLPNFTFIAFVNRIDLAETKLGENFSHAFKLRINCVKDKRFIFFGLFRVKRNVIVLLPNVDYC